MIETLTPIEYAVWDFGFLSFVLVSDFEFRISSFCGMFA
jgi:hypothetical protein